MNDKSDDTLNHLLQRWREQNAPAEAELKRLCSRISESIDEARFLDLPIEPPRSTLRALRAGLWFALGGAVAVLLMLNLRADNQLPQSETARGDQLQALPLAVQLPQSQLAEKARLLAGMEETFNGRLAWVAEHGSRVQLGLVSDAERSSRDAKPLAVRVVVLARKAGDSAWRPVWQADAIAHDEETVNFAGEKARDGSLRLWMHPLPDGAVAIDTDLAVSGPVPIRSTFSGVQQGGVPQRVLSMKGDEAEYQVYQTVALLAAR